MEIVYKNTSCVVIIVEKNASFPMH